MKELLGFNLYSKLKAESVFQKPDFSRYTKKMIPFLIDFENNLKEHQVTSRERRPDEVVIINPREDIIIEEVHSMLDSEVDIGKVKSIISQINDLCNPLPEELKPAKDNPPPYLKKVIVVGEQIPVGKDQKQKPKPKPPMKRNNKEKPIKFEGRRG